MQITKTWRLILGVVVVIAGLGAWGTDITAAPQEQVIQIKAKKFEYIPSEITVKKGVPVMLELTSLDRLHGFKCDDLGIRGDVYPKKVTKIRFVPDKTGDFEFHCDNFCGSGHDHMRGMIHVVE